MCYKVPLYSTCCFQGNKEPKGIVIERSRMQPLLIFPYRRTRSNPLGHFDRGRNPDAGMCLWFMMIGTFIRILQEERGLSDRAVIRVDWVIGFLSWQVICKVTHRHTLCLNRLPWPKTNNSFTRCLFGALAQIRSQTPQSLSSNQTKVVTSSTCCQLHLCLLWYSTRQWE